MYWVACCTSAGPPALLGLALRSGRYFVLTRPGLQGPRPVLCDPIVLLSQSFFRSLDWSANFVLPFPAGIRKLGRLDVERHLSRDETVQSCADPTRIVLAVWLGSGLQKP